jgi:asparagine synthase (glutamine-hydrolysing)
MFAGAYSMAKGVELSDLLCSNIERLTSRDPSQSSVTARSPGFFVAKVDIQAYGAPAFSRRRHDSVAVLAGEPLLDLAGSAPLANRQDELDVLHSHWDRDDWAILRAGRGVFNAAHYDASRNRLCLIADKLGTRPLYYWRGRDTVVFATALRILEELSEVPKALDPRGLAEEVAFGFALSTRTAYRNISVLHAAEIVCFSESEVSSRRYWRWDAEFDNTANPAEAAAEAYRRFKDAVALRLRGDRRAVAFLSGGLDSRCVTAALRDHHVSVQTLSFGSVGSQDQVFSEQIANCLETIHHQIDRTPQMRDATSRMMAAKRAWDESPHRKAQQPERPLLFWSGDGGSVGVGHVYLTRPVVSLMRDGKVDAAITMFLQQQGIHVLRRLLQPDFLELVADAPERGIREEIEDIRSTDRGRAFHLFLLLNDQRRHLAAYYENIDLLGFEQHLPFFDSRFLEFILSLPLDHCLGHRFYMEWIKCFPASVTQVPWQAYPGHEPCPLPVPPQLSYQWSKAPSWLKRVIRRNRLADATRLLQARDFPAHILRRNYLRAAAWIYRLGLRDYSPTIRAAGAYYARSKQTTAGQN